MSSDKIKVLYMAGRGRSGSTLLENALGQIDGFFYVGEPILAWKDSFIDDRTCGCGAPFSQCNVWQKVVTEAFGGIDSLGAEELDRLQRRSARTRHALLALLPGGGTLLKGSS